MDFDEERFKCSAASGRYWKGWGCEWIDKNSKDSSLLDGFLGASGKGTENTRVAVASISNEYNVRNASFSLDTIYLKSAGSNAIFRCLSGSACKILTPKMVQELDKEISAVLQGNPSKPLFNPAPKTMTKATWDTAEGIPQTEKK